MAVVQAARVLSLQQHPVVQVVAVDQTVVRPRQVKAGLLVKEVQAVTHLVLLALAAAAAAKVELERMHRQLWAVTVALA